MQLQPVLAHTKKIQYTDRFFQLEKNWDENKG